MALPMRVQRQQQQFLDPFEDFSNVLGRFLGSGMWGGGQESPLSQLSNYGVDIREDADHIYVDADLPGFQKEDVDLSLENGTLTIFAERREENDQPQAQGQAQGQGQRQQQQGQQQGQQQQQHQQGQQQQAQQGQGQQRQQGQSHSLQHHPQQAGQRQNYLLHERRYQRFVRSFTLPNNVDEQQVNAKMDNGVLKITLNKREESKPKRIQVS